MLSSFDVRARARSRGNTSNRIVMNRGLRVRPRTVIDYVLANAQHIDVVVFIEADLQWESELERLRAAYPYSARKLEDTPYSLAMLSRVKPVSSAVVDASDGYRHAELKLALPGYGRVVTVYGVHPPPPISPHLAGVRNRGLERLARAIGERPHETAIVVGDFNLTPYLPYFSRFLREARLLPARRCLVQRATGPVVLGRAWFGIPIDRSLVTRDVRVISHSVGAHMGSDHLPVTLTVGLGNSN